MRIKAILFAASLFILPIENFAHETVVSPENTMEIQMTKKKKKKKKRGGLFKKKCKCPKTK